MYGTLHYISIKYFYEGELHFIFKKEAKKHHKNLNILMKWISKDSFTRTLYMKKRLSLIEIDEEQGADWGRGALKWGGGGAGGESATWVTGCANKVRRGEGDFLMSLSEQVVRAHCVQDNFYCFIINMNLWISSGFLQRYAPAHCAQPYY